jgi:hypothetical protein
MRLGIVRWTEMAKAIVGTTEQLKAESDNRGLQSHPNSASNYLIRVWGNTMPCGSLNRHVAVDLDRPLHALPEHGQSLSGSEFS